MKAALLAFVLLITTASAQADDLKILGSWHLMTQTQGPLTFVIKLRIEPNQVTAISECSMDGKQASVEATSPAIVSDSSIQILQSASNSISKDGLDCNTNIEASTMDIRVSADGESFLVLPEGSLPPATRIN